jgi:hypothetical protein
MAALACLSLAAMAVAHTKRFDSDVHLDQVKPTPTNPDRFEGEVSSDRLNCQRDRLVRVKKLVPGPNETVGSDTTNDAGEFVVDEPGDFAPGDYRAVAIRKVLKKNANHKHVCPTAQSNDRNVPDTGP